MLHEEITVQNTIQASRFVLRPLRKSDAGLIAMYAGDDRVARGTRAMPHPLPPGTVEAMIDRASQTERTEDVWVIDGSAHGHAEALGLIKSRGPNHFDALVLDVVMPKMTGPEAYDEISEVAAGLPVLFMSGCPVTSTDRIVRPLVMKPFHPNLLLERVSQLLDVSQALEN